MTMVREKRREERILLETPLQFAKGVGITRDISNSGIYFLTRENLVPGGELSFSLKLDYACPGKPVTMKCQGQVLRVETKGEQFGVAASIGECWCTH